MSEYTKGPWVLEKGEGWTEKYPRNTVVRAEWEEPVDGRLGYEICRLSGVADHTMPNANLIAAAPELLEALMGLMPFMWAEGYADQTPAMAQAEAAIKKAVAR
jgi:hypothetical protein